MGFLRIHIVLGKRSTCVYYTDMAVDINDKVVVDTRYGRCIGKVSTIDGPVQGNPFTSDGQYHATCRVVENITKKIYDKECILMSSAKTVEVQHVNSTHKNIVMTDLDLSLGDLVVYERSPKLPEEHGTSMSVGYVTNTDPAALSANCWVVCKIDLTAYTERKERLKKAAKLRAQLNEKKKQYEDVELLRLIAANDPETKRLLDEYTELLGK